MNKIPAHGSLSGWDDYPVHQVAETVRHVATSDRNFYDRYYFNCHSNDGEAFLIFGMGQYPNLAVADAFALLVVGDTHRVVRASRELGDRMDTTVGPLSVEVIRPLQELRIACDPRNGEEAGYGLSFDLRWVGSIPAHEEPRQLLRSHGRVVFDTMRLAQTGRWDGHIELDGHRFDVSADSWWGCRDRSWGVRPVGEAEPPGVRSDGQMNGMWNYAPMQFEDHSILYIVNQEEDGLRPLEEAVRIWNDPGREPEFLGRPEHRHELMGGTRWIKGSVLEFPHAPDGGFEVRVTPLLDAWVMLGTGYGLEEDWRHGMYQGAEVVQEVRLDYADDSDQLFGLVDQVSRCEQSTGAVGYGMHEYMFIDTFTHYGLNGWDPVTGK